LLLAWTSTDRCRQNTVCWVIYAVHIWLLNNVLLSTSVSCCICDSSIPRHGRIAGVHHTLFNLKKNSTEISEILKIVDGTENGRTTSWVFLQVQKWHDLPLLQMLNAWYIQQQAKQMKMWIKWRPLSSKTEEWPPMKLLTFWELYLGHFRPFWKTKDLRSGIQGTDSMHTVFICVWISG